VNIKANENLTFFIESIVNSYAQIFFSLNKPLGVMVMLVTFINPFLGACGLCAVILINLFAKLFGFTYSLIYQGMYGFNALLLGLAMGYEYKFNTEFAIVFVAAVLILLIFTVWAGIFFGKQQLPYLSLPFLFTYWLVYLACGNFEFIQLQEQHIYVENYIANQSLSPAYVFAHSLDNCPMPLLMKSFFKTLSSTFFQNSVLAGIGIATAMLYFSRIAFSLSIIGFISAYFTFKLLGVNTLLLTDYLVGSNFIFFAIGIGCFYVVPSKWTYLSVLMLTPVLVIFYISIQKFLLPFQLKSFTLSFSLLTILFLFFLNHRNVHRFIHLVTIQYYSAEKTIYKHLTTTKRFAHAHLAKLQLPFWGEWQVSQGYKGMITHLGNWSDALDFVITGEESKTYKESGVKCTDFYCYNKPVVAPLDGYVHEVINNVDENEIGKVNIADNWGNTIILNHNNGLFTQISHIKKDSFKVKAGDYVEKGALLATCGNSGRSPEPHIHFQLQLSPKKGSKTIPYPIAYFMEGKKGSCQLKTFEVPKENTTISNIDVVELLKQSYDFSPGKTIKLTEQFSNYSEHEWKIFTDAYNRTYIFCETTKSTVWFVNDGVMFYCYDFEGDTTSLLFNFYLANYRILMAAYMQSEITDTYPLIHFNNTAVQLLQDFVAPFFLFTKANYAVSVADCDNYNNPKQIKIQSSATAKLFGKTIQEKHFEMTYYESALQTFTIIHQDEKRSYSCSVV